MSDGTHLNSPLTPPKHSHMRIRNVNYEGSYLPGAPCNMADKPDFGQMEPPCELRIDALNTATQNVGR